ncbi:MAG: hypothetical protein HFE84_10140 [Lachnospiraceae bacterium]|nr:hypothetical protein [Lachnospiraceae bacterium]
MRNNLAIYATYDKNGKIDDYILYCLHELRKVADDIAVVSNAKLPRKEKDKLSMVRYLYEREDTGYDAGGFAYALDRLRGEGRLETYDAVLFMNDSVFGPFYPFQEMFETMEKREDLDFWGITKRGVSDFDGGDAVYPEHIQLYFYVVRKRMLQSADFTEYWTTLPQKLTDFRSAILKYEFLFTKYFADRGFRWDVYCKTDGYVTENPHLNISPYHYCSYELVKEARCPLLKRRLFTGDFVEGRFSDRSDLRKAVSYLADNTAYDMDLIWSHILRTYPLGAVMESMQMYELLDTPAGASLPQRLPVRVIDLFGNVLQNAGLAVNGFFPAEYTLFIAIEENGTIPRALLDAQKHCILQNLVNDEAYLLGVCELFAGNPRLGMLIPPANVFGKLSGSLEKRWKREDLAVKIRDAYHLTVPFGTCAPTHDFYAFWCRSSVLDAPLLEALKADRTGTMMQMMPLFAQQKGYYTEVLVGRAYVVGLLANMQRTMYEFFHMQGYALAEDKDIEELKEEAYKRQIAGFIGKKDKVYVYGAGQLACRVIRILEGMRKPSGIVVSDKNGNAETICGYPVKGIEEANLQGCILILAVGEKNNTAVEERLKKLGITDYLTLV